MARTFTLSFNRQRNFNIMIILKYEVYFNAHVILEFECDFKNSRNIGHETSDMKVRV